MTNDLKRIPRALPLLAVALFTVGASKAPEVGQPAPSFELTLVDGSKINLDQMRGDVIVLNFWATWCVPCRAELPLLDRYYEIQRTKGLRVYAITTEDSLPLFQLKKLFAALHITPAKRIKGGYGNVSAVPTNFIIDRAGRLRYAKAAAFDLDDLNKQLVPLLNEPRPAAALAPAS